MENQTKHSEKDGRKSKQNNQIQQSESRSRLGRVIIILKHMPAMFQIKVAVGYRVGTMTVLAINSYQCIRAVVRLSNVHTDKIARQARIRKHCQDRQRNLALTLVYRF